MSRPEVEFNLLPHTDGSAKYDWQGFNIVGAVNGPIEPQRRDELPEEAVIEVNVRPASGVGGTRERLLEQIIHSTLKSTILTQDHPRTLIQLTLQILSTPEAELNPTSVPQYASHLPPLPHLLNTALLTVLSANIPLAKTYTAAHCSVISDSEESERTVLFPEFKVMKRADSNWVFVFSSLGENLLVENEGSCEKDSLHEVFTTAENACIGDQPSSSTGTEISGNLQNWLRNIVKEQWHKSRGLVGES